MNVLATQAIWTRLRLLLAVLLSLHLGLAQAVMVHPAFDNAKAVAEADASAAMPCHHHADSNQPPPGSDSQHKDGCCGLGSCHCAAVCGLPVAPTMVTFIRSRAVPAFILHSVLAGPRVPDLRPPIL